MSNPIIVVIPLWVIMAVLVFPYIDFSFGWTVTREKIPLTEWAALIRMVAGTGALTALLLLVKV
jgi:hypothetical protein